MLTPLTHWMFAQYMTASLLLTMYATEYCWIENFPWIDPSVTKPTLTWLIPLRMPLVPILPGPSMAEEAATPRQWWLAHHTALFSQTLSTSVRRPSLLSKCTQARDIETRFIQKYIGDLYIYIEYSGRLGKRQILKRGKIIFCNYSTWSRWTIPPPLHSGASCSGRGLVMTGRHGRPKIDFPGTHGRPSGGKCPIHPKHPLFGTNESPSLQIIDTRLKDICADHKKQSSNPFLT